MKIKEVTSNQVHYITTDEPDYNHYTRHNGGYWTRTMGESEEPFHFSDELEKVFQEWLNPPVEEDENGDPVTYKLMFSGGGPYEPIKILPTSSMHHGEPYPFLSPKEASDWARNNLSSDYGWYVEVIED